MKRLILLLFLSAFTLSVFAQEYTAGIYGGMATLNSPNSYTLDVAHGGLGFGDGYCAGLKAKYKPDSGHLSYTCQLHISHYSSDEYNINVKENFYKAGAGVEYALLLDPTSINPYFALELYYSRLGEITMEANEIELKIDGESRLGIGFGGGFLVPLTDFASLDLGARVNANNLFFKEDGEKSIWSTLLTVGFLYSFN